VRHSETLPSWAAISSVMTRRVTRGTRSMGRLHVLPSPAARAAWPTR